jgi:hypothetical protein
MKRKSVELLIKAIQLLEPNLRVYNQDSGELVLQAENKVNWYRGTANKLKERIAVKKEKILAIKECIDSEYYENELEKLTLKDQALEEEQQIMDIEMDIAAKDFYASMFVNRIRYNEETQKQLSAEAELLLKDYVSVAEGIVVDENVSQGTKAMLHGLLAICHKGFQTMAARNSVYVELRDALLNIGVKL